MQWCNPELEIMKGINALGIPAVLILSAYPEDAVLVHVHAVFSQEGYIDRLDRIQLDAYGPIPDALAEPGEFPPLSALNRVIDAFAGRAGVIGSQYFDSFEVVTAPTVQRFSDQLDLATSQIEVVCRPITE